MKIKLCVLKKGVALKNDKESKDKEVVQVVAVVGEWRGYGDYGGFSITRANIAQMVANFNAMGRDIVIDYEHQTLGGGEAPAAGWIKKLEQKEDELEATIIWTEKAKEYIKNGEYKYLSPVFNFDTKNNESGEYVGASLHSVALTNSPFLSELGEVVLADKPDTKEDEEIKAEKIDNEDELDVGEEFEEDTETLEDEIAKVKVENAILKGKLPKEQESWALTYCKKDPAGFEAYLENAKVLKLPENNMYVNKNKSPQQEDEVDVVAAATKNYKGDK